MDMGDKEKSELEKRNEDPMNYHSPSSMSSDWRFSAANLSNASMGMVPRGNPMAVCKGDLMGSSSCSAASMVDSYSPTLWDHPTNSHITGYGDINLQNNTSPSSILGIRKGGPASLRSLIDRTLDVGWNPPNSLLKGGIFLPNPPRMLPQSLSQFPADSAFIERAARFSSFNGGSFSDMMNPFYVPDSMALYSRGVGVMQEQQDVYAGNGLKTTPGGQKNELNEGEASKIFSVSLDQGATEGSPLKNERRSESLVRSHDEAKQGVGGSGSESDEAEYSGGGGQDEPCMLDGSGKEPSAKGIGLKKRKRSVQDTELDQTKEAIQQPGDSVKTEIQQKGDQNPTSATKRTTGKHGKQGSQASDSPKEDYIHIRARRGQATNSHSLAERVRREKISERMKYLQDLVPGCSKVTGKAVMLDEIINYVQSLQRQVEFLSMKLATVNPRLDFNIEGLLAKDILQPRAGPSSSLMFTPDTSMAYPLPHPSYTGLIQAGVPGLGSSSNMLRRNINPQLAPMSGELKEPAQLPNMWEDELHNVVQMNFGTSALLSSQEVNESPPPGQLKVELK